MDLFVGTDGMGGTYQLTLFAKIWVAAKRIDCCHRNVHPQFVDIGMMITITVMKFVDVVMMVVFALALMMMMHDGHVKKINLQVYADESFRDDLNAGVM